jgi:hypothetical protein
MRAKPPLTADEARAIVAEMQRKTSKRAAVQLLRHAVNGFGAYRPNISNAAREVYRAEMERLTAS